MSFVEKGLEKGYIEKQPTEDKREEVYIIFPKRIPLNLCLTGIINEFNSLGYDIAYVKRDGRYIVSNHTLLHKKEEEAMNHIDKVDKVCEECDEPYNDLKHHLFGATMFIAQDTKIDFKEALGIVCSKLYNEGVKWFDEGGYEKVKEVERKIANEEVNYILEELDRVIRSAKCKEKN